MNSRQAINLLKGLEQSLDDYCELNDEGKAAFRMAITALELFGNAEQLPTIEPQPQWIPCSERVPDEDYWTGANFQYSADVLMTVYNAEDEETIIDYGHTVNGSWYSDTTDCLVPSWWEVLAWMPLPEPAKEDDYETD